ncbi:SCO4226 family nickel-binding protein [Streptomyces sp. NPDC001443]
MPRFMDIHHGMQGITADQLDAAHKADLAIEGEERVHFERAWADPATGTVYCLSEAPSAEAVQRVHERAGHKADEIHEVPLSVW